MKRFKYCLILLAVLLCSGEAFAAGAIEMTEKTSLTISTVYEKQPVSGMQFDAYLISNVDDCGELTPIPAFDKWKEALDIRGENDSAWQTMAETLEREIVLDASMKPSRSALTDQNGVAAFEDIPMGLYLVIGTGATRGDYVYTTAPFFVMLPEQDLTTNTWSYHVAANTKPNKNPLEADYRVLKIWQDDCHKSQRPKSITIQLMCDGEPYGDPVNLPENGRWEHTWEALEVNHKWTVTEETQTGYMTPKIEKDGYQFTVTNTCNRQTGITKLPQTGQLWWPVPLLLCGGLVLVIGGLVRRRGGRNANER